MAQYGTIITTIGLAQIANAQVTQSKVGLEYVALGDGNGAHYVPTQNQTALVNEVWRGLVSNVTIDSNNENRIIIDAVIPVTAGGFTIREIGVFDDQNQLIAVGQYPEKYKPQLSEGVSEETLIHFVIETNNADVVKLSVDPTIVIASRKYVDDKIAENLSDFEYQTPTIVGSQLRLTRKSGTHRLFIKIANDLSGPLTVSLNGGASSKPLVDVNGEAVNQIEKGFAEVVEDTSFFTLRSRGISSTELQALIAIVNEAEANESDLKTQFARAVNEVDMDGGINLSDHAAWAEILAQVPNIKTGKKWASGTASSDLNSRVNFILANNSRTELSYYITVSGVEFKPSLIFAIGTNGTLIYQTVYFSGSDGLYADTTKISNHDGATGAQTTTNFKANGADGYVIFGGFRIPVGIFNQQFKWIAFE